jgi:hypothetical protein
MWPLVSDEKKLFSSKPPSHREFRLAGRHRHALEACFRCGRIALMHSDLTFQMAQVPGSFLCKEYFEGLNAKETARRERRAMWTMRCGFLAGSGLLSDFGI